MPVFFHQMKVIDCYDWDELVVQTYGRPYCLQQQNGCMERGSIEISVPCEPEDFENDTIPEVVNGDEMGVSFNAWLERDPKQPPKMPQPNLEDFYTEIFWHRNFYPNLETLANDLNRRGILPAGDYLIKIDW